LAKQLELDETAGKGELVVELERLLGYSNSFSLVRSYKSNTRL
jgi:hypothetical protein